MSDGLQTAVAYRGRSHRVARLEEVTTWIPGSSGQWSNSTHDKTNSVGSSECSCRKLLPGGLDSLNEYVRSRAVFLVNPCLAAGLDAVSRILATSLSRSPGRVMS